MQAVILAEGEGRRLRPLTEHTPKPLLEIGGRPLIYYTLWLFREHGIRDFVICTSYMRDIIRQALDGGLGLDISIEYSESRELSGTAGALKKAERLIDSDRFFVANSDEIRDIDLFAMRRFHEDREADATIALTRVKDVSEFGSVRLEGGRITEFMEKPKDRSPGIVNAGLYLMEKRVLGMIPATCSPMLEKDVFPGIAAKGSLHGFEFGGRWITLNTLEQYEAAQKAAKSWD